MSRVEYTYVRTNTVSAVSTALSTALLSAAFIPEPIQALAHKLVPLLRALGVGHTAGVVAVQAVASLTLALMSRDEVHTDMLTPSVVIQALVVVCRRWYS